MLNIRIGSVLDFSTIDWPGNRTLMIFCSGCNFRCPFCMNAPLIPTTSGAEVNLKFIMDRILANINFLDAVGISGGDPGLQPEPILALCNWAKKQGIRTFLNTNGSNPRLLQRLLAQNLLDYAAIDIKAPLRSSIYGKVIGLNEGVETILINIMQSLELCKKYHLPVEIRTTIVPTLIDDERSICEIATIAKDYGSYVLQQYFPYDDVLDLKLRAVRPPDRSVLVKLAKLSVERGVKEVYIRSRENGMERIK